MAERAHLSVVGPDDQPPPRTPETITEALSESRRNVLAAMRKALARKLDDGEVSSNAIASAYKELRELDRLIRQYDDEAAAAKEGESGRRTRSNAFDASAI